MIMRGYATTPEHSSLYGNYPDDTYFDFGDDPINYLVTDQEEGFIKVAIVLPRIFFQRVTRGYIWVVQCGGGLGLTRNKCVSLLEKAVHSGSTVLHPYL